MQAFVAHRPRDDLAHALHLVKAREVHQHGKGRKQLQAFGKTAEHSQRPANIAVALHAEFLHIVMLVAHGLIFHEGAEFRFRHADGFQQKRIGGDMDGFHIGKGRQHHLDLSRLKHPTIAVHIIVLNLDIRLREEAENLRQQIAFLIIELGCPVLAIFAERHLFGQPMDLLLLFTKVIGPWVAKGLVAVGRGQEAGLDQ